MLYTYCLFDALLKLFKLFRYVERRGGACFPYMIIVNPLNFFLYKTSDSSWKWFSTLQSLIKKNQIRFKTLPQEDAARCSYMNRGRTLKTTLNIIHIQLSELWLSCSSLFEMQCGIETTFSKETWRYDLAYNRFLMWYLKTSVLKISEQM